MEFTKYGITETPKLIYNNPLASKSDIDGFVLEGTANISFPEGKLRMENGLSAAQGQKANYVLWCPKNFPSNVYIEVRRRTFSITNILGRRTDTM